MPSRRTLIASALIATGLTASGLRWRSLQAGHLEAAAALRQPRDTDSFEGLVHYATLAANSHNAQAWRFRQTPQGVAIMPDMQRALAVADADNHHLYTSLGCAAENLMLAARSSGRSVALDFDDADDGSLDIGMGAAGQQDPLFDAILARQCSRSVYDGRSVSAADRQALTMAARIEGCDLLFIEDRTRIEQVLELIVAANTAQVDNPAFAEELKHWLRFNAQEAITTGDGLYSASSGNPGMPTFLGRRLFDAFFTAQSENARYVQQVRSSAGLVIVVSAKDDRRHWVQAGRSYQRFALQATALGIRHAHLNQPLEVASIRPALQSLLGLGQQRADLVLRYGYGPPMPPSLRRPVRAVIES